VNPADWDGDGLFDLVIGSGHGSVVWFRNVGTAGKPKFGARQELVPVRSESIFLTQYLEPDEEPSTGVRAQIAVVDYDGDGRLDLLVGDYSEIRRLRALTPEERTRVDKLRRMDEGFVKTLVEHHGDDSDDQRHALAEHEAALKSLEKFTNDGGVEPKTSSFVWLFLRSRGAHEASSGR
jgi:hypothetical protein